MLLTQLEYFVAVAREQHFGRAAAACFVSASALSEAIRKLEVELGVPLVRRGRAFEGLTPEGELALGWARRLLADDRALRDEVAGARGRLDAHVRFGVIPSALHRAATLVTALAERHPAIRVQMQTGLTTEEIVARIRRYELDAGLIHPAVDDATDLVLTPVHEETMMVVGAPASFGHDRDEVTGIELAAMPLCLLEPHMRARRLIDEAFVREGIVLSPRIESDSIEGLLALARTGHWVAVVPRAAAQVAGGAAELRAVRMSHPAVTLPIALARLADEPLPAVAAALDEAARSLR